MLLRVLVTTVVLGLTLCVQALWVRDAVAQIYGSTAIEAPRPVTTYYAPYSAYYGAYSATTVSPGVTTYYAPGVASPTVTYYGAPPAVASQVTSYYAPSPTVVYRPSGWTTSYYAPTVSTTPITVMPTPMYVAPRYVPGQPVRNVLRSLAP